MQFKLGLAAGLLAALSLPAGAQMHHHMPMAGPSEGAPALAQAHDVTASGCWIRQLPPGVPSGAFLVIRNQGDQPAVLMAAHAAAWGQAMLHQTEMQGDVSRMSMAHAITVPAGGELTLEPGGYHLMLEEPTTALKPGDHTDVTLVFKDRTQVVAHCEVKPADATE